MNKLAIFVEGYTEVVFVEKLIEEIAGQNKVQIELKRIRGGRRVPRQLTQINAVKPNTGQAYYVLILDCMGDNQVKTRMIEEHVGMTAAGYSRLIGIRDVRPDFVYGDISKLEAKLPVGVDVKLAPITFILAIMEIEAWFLGEASHYPKIEPSITVAAIKAALGFDPENDDMQQRPFPSNDLNNCYVIGGKIYKKDQAKATVDVLDYAFIYMELHNKIHYLGRLISDIDAFLT